MVYPIVFAGDRRISDNQSLGRRREGIGTTSRAAQPLAKLATRTEGFDELSRGGLPRNRAGLLIRSPGAQRGPGRYVVQKMRKRGRKISRLQHKPKARGTRISTVVVLRLYIVGGAPNSVQAIANLEAICQECLKDGYKLEVVDILEHPRRAIADGVLVTPSLVKVSPRPTTNVVGNLSDKNKVLLALGLQRKCK